MRAEKVRVFKYFTVELFPDGKGFKKTPDLKDIFIL